MMRDLYHWWQEERKRKSLSPNYSAGNNGIFYLSCYGWYESWPDRIAALGLSVLVILIAKQGWLSEVDYVLATVGSYYGGLNLGCLVVDRCVDTERQTKK